MIEAEHTYRGHTGPLFALASNNAEDRDKALLYSAGSEGIIRIWKLPPTVAQQRSYTMGGDERFRLLETSPENEMTDGKNFCVGVFSSHKDVVWQLVYHPVDDMLLSVSSDGSVKLWKSFDFLYGRGCPGEGGSSNQYFESIEQCTNHCLMGSFLQKRGNGILETPTSAAWVKSHPNMLVISYRNPMFSIFDRVTVSSLSPCYV